MAREFDLRDAQVFAGMTEEELGALARAGHREVFQPGEAVFSGKMRARAFFIVGSGGVDVTVRQPDGRSVVVATLHPGTSFGEAAMFDGQPRNAVGSARGTTACWVLDADGLDRLRHESPTAATKLMINLGRSMAERLERIVAQVNESVDGDDTRSSRFAGVMSWKLLDRLMGKH